MSKKEGTKLCKHCKTEIPAAAKVCPNCRKKQGGIVKWIVIGFAAIGVIGAASGGSDSDTKQESNNNVQETSNLQTQNNTQSEDSAIKESEKETENKSNEVEETKDKYYVGDTWQNKYVNVSFDKCGEYESDNQFVQPADGNNYIYGTFTFENIGKSDTTVGYWDFDCYADGYACDGMYVADDAAFTQTLSSGRKISGSVYFEVPEDATEIEFEYSPSFWTSEKIVFVFE